MPDTTNADDRHDYARPAGSLPFFARFLEGQNREGYPNEEGLLQASPEKRMTLKYPSDRDEWDPFLDS